jgi:hypothetical protein
MEFYYIPRDKVPKLLEELDSITDVKGSERLKNYNMWKTIFEYAECVCEDGYEYGFQRGGVWARVVKKELID